MAPGSSQKKPHGRQRPTAQPSGSSVIDEVDTTTAATEEERKDPDRSNLNPQASDSNCNSLPPNSNERTSNLGEPDSDNAALSSSQRSFAMERTERNDSERTGANFASSANSSQDATGHPGCYVPTSKDRGLSVPQVSKDVQVPDTTDWNENEGLDSEKAFADIAPAARRPTSLEIVDELDRRIARKQYSPSFANLKTEEDGGDRSGMSDEIIDSMDRRISLEQTSVIDRTDLENEGDSPLPFSGRGSLSVQKSMEERIARKSSKLLAAGGDEYAGMVSEGPSSSDTTAVGPGALAVIRSMDSRRARKSVESLSGRHSSHSLSLDPDSTNTPLGPGALSAHHSMERRSQRKSANNSALLGCVDDGSESSQSKSSQATQGQQDGLSSSLQKKCPPDDPSGRQGCLSPCSRNPFESDTDSWDENGQHVTVPTPPNRPGPNVRPGAFPVYDGTPVWNPARRRFRSPEAQGDNRTNLSPPSGEEEFHSIHANAFVVAPSNRNSNQEGDEGTHIQVAVLANDKWVMNLRERRNQIVLVLFVVTIAVALSLVIILSKDSSSGGPEEQSGGHVGKHLTSFPHTGSPTETGSPSAFHTAAPTRLLWRQMGSAIDGQSRYNYLGTSIGLANDGSRLAVAGEKNYLGGLGVVPYVRVYEFRDENWILLGEDILLADGVREAGQTVAISGDGNRVAAADRLTESIHLQMFELQSESWDPMGSAIPSSADGTSFVLSRDGSVIAVGNPNYESGGISVGRVRVLQFLNGNWTGLGAEIVGDEFARQCGRAVSLSDNGQVVAFGAVDDQRSGRVRIYAYEGGTWAQLGQDLEGDAAFDQFGLGVSLSSNGTTVAVAARFSDDMGDKSGKVKVYQYDISLNAWVHLGGDVVGKIPGDQFGYSVSLSSDASTIAASSPYRGFHSGQVRIFKHVHSASQQVSGIFKHLNSTWQQIGGDLDGQEGDRFGTTLSLSADGRRVAIGAPHSDGNGVHSGRVHVFELQSVYGASPTSNPTRSLTPTVSPTKIPTSIPTTVPTVSPSIGPCGEREIRFELNLVTDDWGNEISWNLTDANGFMVASGASYGNSRTYLFQQCLSPGCFGFTIFDSAGDGICCGGGYSVSVDGDVIASDGHFSFGTSESTSFGVC